MNSESYSYTAERYGNHWVGDTTYNNASKNYFSILQLSAGYELAISSKTKISIEPYVKIPMVGHWHRWFAYFQCRLVSGYHPFIPLNLTAEFLLCERKFFSG